MTGVLGIARGERAPASALSAGEETLGLALLEAHAQLLNDPSSPVLVVYADEPVDPLYGPREEGEESGALSILFDSRATQVLECSRAPRTAPADARAPFGTQIDALMHCLESKSTARWQAQSANASGVWQWSLREKAG